MSGVKFAEHNWVHGDQLGPPDQDAGKGTSNAALPARCPLLGRRRPRPLTTRRIGAIWQLASSAICPGGRPRACMNWRFQPPWPHRRHQHVFGRLWCTRRLRELSPIRLEVGDRVSRHQPHAPHQRLSGAHRSGRRSGEPTFRVRAGSSPTPCLDQSDGGRSFRHRFARCAHSSLRSPRLPARGGLRRSAHE